VITQNLLLVALHVVSMFWCYSVCHVWVNHAIYLHLFWDLIDKQTFLSIVAINSWLHAFVCPTTKFRQAALQLGCQHNRHGTDGSCTSSEKKKHLMKCVCSYVFANIVCLKLTARAGLQIIPSQQVEDLDPFGPHLDSIWTKKKLRPLNCCIPYFDLQILFMTFRPILKVLRP